MVCDELGVIDGLTEVSTLGKEDGRLVGFLEDAKDGLIMVGEYDGDLVGIDDERAVGDFVGEKLGVIEGLTDVGADEEDFCDSVGDAVLDFDGGFVGFNNE